MSSEYFCKICDIPCTGKAPYEQHLNSAKHMKKAKLNESQASSEQPVLVPSTSPSSASPTINSRLNFATTTDNTSENSSISSSTLSISSETMRILLEWNHPHGYKPYCDICQLPLHGDQIADIHFHPDNKIHNQKLAAWKQIRENDARYSCKVCSEIFVTENVMREHFNSDNHNNIIQQKTNLEKIIKIYETYNKLKQVRTQSKEKSRISEDELSNHFKTLTVDDGTAQSVKPKKTYTIDREQLAKVMNTKYDNDD